MRVVEEVEEVQDVEPAVRLTDIWGAKGGSGGIWGMADSGEEDVPRRLPLALVMSPLGWVGRSGGEYWVPASTFAVTDAEGELWTETERGLLCGLGGARGDCVG